MTLDEITEAGISPALSLLPARMDSYEARIMLLTIGQQESKFVHRRQMNNGPAMGFWQFERGGGVKGVMQHDAVRTLTRKLCEARGYAFDAREIWAALEFDDVLAAGLARLLLYTDPKPLPAVHDSAGAWNYYLRNWRPGKPHPATWASYHLNSRRFLGIAS